MSVFESIADSDFGPVKKFLGEALLRILAFFGLAMGGGQAAAAAEIQQLQQESLFESPNTALTPEQLALGKLRGVPPPWAEESEAKRSGVDAERLAYMVEITGEPPGLEQLLEAYRRGYIDKPTLEHGIRQSRVRNEWIPTVEQLRYMPPGAGEVLAAWVQSHLSDSDAHSKLVDAGVDPKEHDWLYQTTGRPPAAEEMLTLLNRKLVSEDDVKLAIRESDIKNKYIDAILQTRVYIPPVRTIGVLIANGALTDDQARELYRENGVRDSDIAAYIASAHHTKTSSAKHLAVSEIQTLYEERFVSKDDSAKTLIALGYDEHDADLVLAVADLRRWRKFLDTAISKMHSLYVGHKMNANEVGTALDQLGIQSQQKADLLHLWLLEREGNVRLLTPSQIIHAMNYEIITQDEALAELESLGYSTRDATILILLEVGVPGQTTL